MRTTIFNFSGIYESEDFYKVESPRFSHEKNIDGTNAEKLEAFSVIDCRDITGTNCICDDYAIEEIRRRIQWLFSKMSPAPVEEKKAKTDADSIEEMTKEITDSETIENTKLLEDFAKSIHFIDSGNYHYMSALMLSYIRQPLTLVLFDHHPDTQSPAFGDILSCGGWVRWILEHSHYVKQVIAIGVDQDLAKDNAVDLIEEGKIHFYSPEECMDENGKGKLPEIPEYPVYLSIDKDVFSEEELQTNWDQGEMSIAHLMEIVGKLIGKHEVIGCDICGEPAPFQEGIDVDAEARRSSWMNRKLTELIR